MTLYGFRHPTVRWITALLLVVAVVLLGAAAKRSQFPSVNSSSCYLAKAVKMAEVRFDGTGTAVLIPSPSPQCIESLPVPNRFVSARFRIEGKPLRIELQSPPLLV